ncbi:uncharacterized protein K441DRAFT_455207, partial [Cenococcum geophilum 1.58]|uniref:uncharacterized protein n=1 Tax=Cenococcum geophilum 1.58 TaxID=794803 RepID=UPI00358F6D98
GSENRDAGLSTANKFACPYFKRNPRKYQRVRACPGPGWDTLHRLKEHLYRKHALPIQCPRCCRPFENDAALNKHHQALEGCELGQGEAIESFNKEQEKRLRSRKRPALEQTEEDKWKEVYRILFPDYNLSTIPSPCKHISSHYYTNVYRMPNFLSRELPCRVREMLEVAMNDELQPIEDKLKSQLVDMVRTCQEDLFRAYQQ